VDASIQFDRQAMFEAIEINAPVFEAALAAELRAQPPPAQKAPRCSFGFSLVVPQFANKLGCQAHQSSRSGCEILSFTREVTPHPSDSGW